MPLEGILRATQPFLDHLLLPFTAPADQQWSPVHLQMVTEGRARGPAPEDKWGGSGDPTRAQGSDGVQVSFFISPNLTLVALASPAAGIFTAGFRFQTLS